jgi:malate dehydrogenase (oxaloacetate-decarboxylating)
MQGTGAITLAAALSAARMSGTPLRDQRIVLFGAGTAGIGIAEQLRDAMVAEGLTPEAARRRFWCLGRHGLLLESMDGLLRDFQRPWARSDAETHSFRRNGSAEPITLADVVREVQPTMLIGTSTVPGSFTEAIVSEMAAHVERPIILPLSNPTELSEALPADLLTWTSGRALIATGSPFSPVNYRGTSYAIAQANNALVFPGLGLGTIVSQAGRISDGMLAAAARAVAGMVGAAMPGASILPEVESMRDVSAVVATAVAKAAADEGLARLPVADAARQVRAAMWQPAYCSVEAI